MVFARSAKGRLISEDMINAARHENSVIPTPNSPNQARNKRARLNTPESEQVGEVSDAELLVFSEDLQKAIEDDVINTGQTLDVVKRGESRLSTQALRLILLRNRHPIFCSSCQSTRATSRRFPSSSGHQVQSSMALGKVERQKLFAVRSTAN